jgi:glycosyltransferase involved in cell wall biosynthesis
MATSPAFFSIIIPTLNRPAQLAQCLAAVAELEYPRDRFEVIVVNDGGEMSPEHVVDLFRERLDVKVITQSHAGPATARNTGAAQARGAFLAFTDDDCEPAHDWLQALAARFAATNDCVVGGRTVNGLTENVYSTTSQVLIDYLCAYYNSDSDEATFVTSNNLAIPTAQFQAIGGFDGSFHRAGAEDREFCDHLRHDGHRIIYASEALVRHGHSMTLSGFWRQHFAYGRGALHFHQLRTLRGQVRIKIEPLRFYLNLLCYPYVKRRSRQRLSISALLLLSQSANAAGFFYENISQIHRRWKTRFKIVAVCKWSVWVFRLIRASTSCTNGSLDLREKKGGHLS